MSNGEVPQISRHACAACKHQRRKCENDCVFAPHFPSTRSDNFKSIHKIFGVKNVTGILKNLSPENRIRAVASLEWEASEWEKNKVDGPLGLFRLVEKELQDLRKQHDDNSSKNNNNNNIVPYSNYQANSGLIGMNHNAVEPGFVSNSHFDAINFDYGDNIPNLGLVAPYNIYGGLPQIRTADSIGNQGLLDNCILFDPYYSRILQGQDRSLAIRERGGDNVLQPSTPTLPRQEMQQKNQMMGGSSSSPSILKPPTNSFSQQNYQQRGSQRSFHGYFEGATSESQGRGLQ